jgi:alanyl-tRNA synthetase
VTQKGSLVTPTRLRFDFAHHKSVSKKELKEISLLVQEQIATNKTLDIEICDIDDAKKKGAMALFGEKYGKEVRVVSISEFSVELCGGIHTPQTGEIGLFTIVSEAGISAGVRRIEALTSAGALSWMEEKIQTLDHISGLLNSPISNLVENIEKNIQQRKDLEKELTQLKKKLAQAKSGDLFTQMKVINGIQIISAEFPGEVDAMREEADRLRNKIGSGVVILGSKQKGVKLIVAVTKDLAGKSVHAGKLIKELAPLIGGGGGGRPDMAQAGGKNPDGLQTALDKALELL